MNADEGMGEVVEEKVGKQAKEKRNLRKQIESGLVNIFKFCGKTINNRLVAEEKQSFCGSFLSQPTDVRLVQLPRDGS